MKTTKEYNNWIDYYTNLKEKSIYNYEKIHHHEIKTHVESDEEILEKIDIKTIENFLRKKKLSNINK